MGPPVGYETMVCWPCPSVNLHPCNFRAKAPEVGGVRLGEEIGLHRFLFFSYQQRCGVNARPAAKFGVRLWAVVAGAFARHKQPTPKSVAGGLFGGWNAGTEETSPSSVRNPDVRKNNYSTFTRRLRREGESVNPRPIANLKVCELAVVRWPVEGVELPGLESADDDWLVDRDSGESKAAVDSSGKTVGKQLGGHWTILSSCPKSL